MFTTLLLLTIQLVVALVLERHMASYALFELFFIFAGLVAATCIYYAEHAKEAFAKIAGAAFYVCAIINLTFLVFMTGAYWWYLFGLFFAIIGFVYSMREDDSDEWENYYGTTSVSGVGSEATLETYHTTEKEQVVDPDPIYVNFARKEPLRAKPVNGVAPKKRGRGRPKGSTNKVAKRGRGRPKGSKNKKK